MKYILAVLLFVGFPVLADELYNELGDKYPLISACVFVADIATAVQQVRHDGDTLSMFESKAPKMLEADGHPEFKINKIMSIGRAVYELPIEVTRRQIFVIFYNECINGSIIQDEGTYM